MQAAQGRNTRQQMEPRQQEWRSRNPIVPHHTTELPYHEIQGCWHCGNPNHHS